MKAMLDIAAEHNIRPDVQLFDLEDANNALWAIKSGGIRGAKVLRV